MKILNLTKAEILKQTKKQSFKICLIILLILAVGLPILFKVFSPDDKSTQLQETNTNIEIYKDEIIQNPKTETDKLKNELNKENIKIENLKLKNNYLNEENDYRYYLYESYKTSKEESIVVSYLLNDKKINTQEIDETFDLNTNNYKDLTKEELISIKNQLQTEYTSLRKTIDDNNYKDYINKQIALLQKNNNQENKKEITNIYNKILKLNITDPNDFRAKYAKKVISYIESKEKILTKTEYNKTDNQISYEKYVKITNKSNEDIDNKIKKCIYAIDNNIDYNKTGVRNALNDITTNNIAFLGLIVVIISGGIVASEYQKGTIRLLVIRPNKRWKILLSKLLTIIILTISIALITYIASFITNGILYNFKDYFINDLTINNGKVKEINFILLSIGKMLIQLIPIIFAGIIAFFLSTITKNTALSVGISIFLQFGYGLIAMILVLINLPYINLTFLPYLDYSQFNDISTLSGNLYMYETYYTLTIANIVLIIWSIILYGISNIVFIKRDIKN